MWLYYHLPELFLLHGSLQFDVIQTQHLLLFLSTIVIKLQILRLHLVPKKYEEN